MPDGSTPIGLNPIDDEKTFLMMNHMMSYDEPDVSALDQLDRFFAGWADMLTMGASTNARGYYYGDDATKNHTGVAFAVGQGVGFVNGVAIGGAAAKSGGRLIGKNGVVFTGAGIGAGLSNSTDKIPNGNATPVEVVAVAPLIGYRLEKG